MTRCMVCKGHAVAKCTDCGLIVCMLHCTMLFDERTRKMASFCGNCTSKRIPAWVKR